MVRQLLVQAMVIIITNLAGQVLQVIHSRLSYHIRSNHILTSETANIVCGFLILQFKRIEPYTIKFNLHQIVFLNSLTINLLPQKIWKDSQGRYPLYKYVLSQIVIQWSNFWTKEGVVSLWRD